ncbi:MAG TPA: 23S rRNA (adenine(2503)-C(2))-methyltransferase RlmN [Desulfatiglandales bacterium]|nr:23S rRNA (adenine(2503)-C(2))-methyltransferase RlmN [Desulfatiglandales bacterium]
MGNNTIYNESKVNLKDLDLEETRLWAEKIGLEPYRVEQIRQWIFKYHVESFSGMTNISKELRDYLASLSTITQLKTVKTEISADGTKKFLFELEDGNSIESVLIPEKDHYTACISSQVGCAMGCSFCLTAAQGLKRSLENFEIIDQIIQISKSMDQPSMLTNIVFMGMGEPLANFEAVKKAVKNIISQDALNFSRRRVTISTCGLVPGIEKMGRELPVKLAVSLNAANDKTRNFLMPINKKYPLKRLIETLKRFPLPKGRRITFEYILIKDINDRPKDAQSLAKIIKDIKAKINLIPFNRYDGSPFESPDEGRILAFQDELIRKNYTVTVRKSKGSDISAACGQLRTGL